MGGGRGKSAKLLLFWEKDLWSGVLRGKQPLSRGKMQARLEKKGKCPEVMQIGVQNRAKLGNCREIKKKFEVIKIFSNKWKKCGVSARIIEKTTNVYEWIKVG